MFSKRFFQLAHFQSALGGSPAGWFFTGFSDLEDGKGDLNLPGPTGGSYSYHGAAGKGLAGGRLSNKQISKPSRKLNPTRKSCPMLSFILGFSGYFVLILWRRLQWQVLPIDSSRVGVSSFHLIARWFIRLCAKMHVEVCQSIFRVTESPFISCQMDLTILLTLWKETWRKRGFIFIWPTISINPKQTIPAWHRAVQFLCTVRLGKKFLVFWTEMAG